MNKRCQPTSIHMKADFYDSKGSKKLTGRELVVLALIASGRSNKIIAENLAITENTVKSHVSNILNKLHLASRTQAALYAWQKGMVCRGGGE